MRKLVRKSAGRPSVNESSPRRSPWMGRIILLLLGSAVLTISLIVWQNEQRLAEQRPEPSAVTLQGGEIIEDPVLPPKPESCQPGSATLPYRLTIPAAGVEEACIKSVGHKMIEGPDGSSSRQIQTASNIHQVGWYNESDRPAESGVVFISGHSSPVYDAVFNRLGAARIGSAIQLERGDGKLFQYEVFEQQTVSIEAANQAMGRLLQPEAGMAILSLVTCSGRWLEDEQTMENRTLIRAKLVRIE